MKKFLSALATLGLLATATSAHAHTQAFGFVPKSNGDVEFFLGTYQPGHSSTAAVEGQLDIMGIGGFAFTTGYNFSTSAASLGLTGPGAFLTQVTSLGPNTIWQSVTVSGLSDGTYVFDYSGTSNAQWDKSGSLLTFPITAMVDVANVPEPATFALFGIGLAGLGFARRRMARAKA